MSSQSVYVAGLGASTSVGRCAWSSAAAVRAGVSGFTEHPYLIDTAGEPMRVALATWLDIRLAGTQRWKALLFPAIDQALRTISEHVDFPIRTAIALALPEPRPGLTSEYQADVQAALVSHYRHTFSLYARFPAGHAAGLLALEAAHRRLTQGTLDACVVAGVDSYIDPYTLEWLDDCDQLHGAGPLNNAWGFIPGEGAGAVLLLREQIARQFSMPVLAQVLGVGTATEDRRIKTETVCTGKGLTQAFQGALQVLPGEEKVTDTYCDLNGEPYRSDEYGFAYLRTKEHFHADSDFVAPADCWGDVSAAGAPLQLALAVIAGQKSYANGDIALIWASSEHGTRGAALLRVKTGAMHAG